MVSTRQASGNMICGYAWRYRTMSDNSARSCRRLSGDAADDVSSARGEQPTENRDKKIPMCRRMRCGRMRCGQSVAMLAATLPG
jgi:hypothetical protein